MSRSATLGLLQRGFGAVAAIMVLVILATMSAGLISFSSGQQLESAQDVLSAQAWQAAYGGSEWGLFQALKNGACTTQTWTHPVYTSFKVTVVCSRSPGAATTYNVGESLPGTPQQVVVFTVTATACNGAAAACPDGTSVANPGYAERQRVAVAYCQWSGGACTGP